MTGTGSSTELSLPARRGDRVAAGRRPARAGRRYVRALEALGARRAAEPATILGVTGSVGKTSTKEALFAALDRGRPGKVHRSVKSYNNHTGVPLSLARMPRDGEYAVLEMGMNHAGEIAALTRLVRPHVAMVTAIAPGAYRAFGVDEAIADAKAEIFEGSSRTASPSSPMIRRSATGWSRRRGAMPIASSPSAAAMPTSRASMRFAAEAAEA